MDYSADRMFSLKGKVAIVTGASRGIGEEIAACFLQAGARVVICSREQAAVDATVQQIQKEQDTVLPLEINVADAADRKRLVAQTMQWGGRIDILVNNAGANPAFGGLEDLTESALDLVINVNLKASMFLSQLVFKAWMKESGGSIVNVSSLGGLQCIPGISGYCAVKAGLNHLTRCMANEWGKYGIRVNAIAPGIIKTKFSRALWESPKFEAMMEKNPISRFGEVDDIAGAALLLASDAASYITGHMMVIDGGMLVTG